MNIDTTMYYYTSFAGIMALVFFRIHQYTLSSLAKYDMHTPSKTMHIISAKKMMDSQLERLPSFPASSWVSTLTSHHLVLTCLSTLSSPSRCKRQNIDSIEFTSDHACCACERSTQFLAANSCQKRQILNLGPYTWRSLWCLICTSHSLISP